MSTYSFNFRYEFYPLIKKSLGSPNPFRNIFWHIVRFNTQTRWQVRRVRADLYTRYTFKRVTHPFNNDPKYKNRGVHGFPKRGAIK